MDFDSDSPIRAFDQDELSFSQFARGLAKEIVEYDRPASFVIGVDGPWGSGKTSLINLTQIAIEELTHDYDWAEQPLIFRFSPWIVGNREALLRDFLPQLARELREQVPWAERSDKAQQAIRAIAKYGRAVRGIETGLTIAAATATLFSIPVPPFLAPLTRLVGLLGRLFGNSEQHTLDELREMARKALEETEIRVLVVLDDLDRLEPEEILGVCRLVRSTVDLPHIAFLVAYDREKAASYINKQLGVDGQDYLEKIVQLPVDVPPVILSDLARMIAERLQRVFPSLTDKQAQRASSVLWGHVRPTLLRSPRDVGRILNQVTFGWAMMSKEADPGDLLLVSSLRIKAPHLLRWARAYCDAFFNERARPSNKDALVAKFQNSFSEACVQDKVSEDQAFDMLSEVLPAMGGFFASKKDLFGDWSNDRVQAAISEKRLASEQHWQSYFDLTPGRFGFTEAWYSSFVADAGSDPQKAIAGFLQMVTKQRPAGGTYAEYLIDRIRADAAAQKFSDQEYKNLFRVLATVADDADKMAGPERSMFTAGIGDQIEWAMGDVLRALPNGARKVEFVTAVNDGKALSTLMALVRSEIRRHGRANGQIREDRQILGANDIDDLCQAVDGRMVSESATNKLLQQHHLAIPLLAWRDAGYLDRMREWVDAAVASDDGLLTFVKALKQMVLSTAGNYWKVSVSLLNVFTSADAAIDRLDRLKTSPNAGVATRAAECRELISKDEDE